MTSSRTIHPIAILFYSNLSTLFIGMGLFPILPLYAAQFGADRAMTGVFFSIIYASLSAGSLLAGALTARFPIKALYIASVTVGIPALILLGRATALWHVIALTSFVWFFGGLNLALISMLVGIHSKKDARGRSYSLLSLTIPMGALLGGAAVGKMVADVGYTWMFLILGLVWVGVPVAGAFLPAEEARRKEAAVPASNPAVGYKPYGISEPFTGVLLISLITAAAISLGRLGTPLSMQFQAFSASQVASSATVSGLVAIPVILASSSLTDRIGRTRFLIASYTLAAAGIVVLSMAGQLWHFWVSASLILIAFCLNGALASAVAADVLPPQELKRGLAWLNAALPAAGIFAYGGTGYLIELLGFRDLFLLTAALPLIAAALLERTLQRCRRQQAAIGAPLVERGVWEENAYIKRCL